MPVHYAPRTPAFRIVSSEELSRIPDPAGIAVVSLGQRPEAQGVPVAHEFCLESPAAASRLLYETLHRCDALGVRTIVVVMPPDRPEWQAVRDRLLRATRPLAERS